MQTVKKILEIYLITYLVFLTGSYSQSFRSDVYVASYIVYGVLLAAWLIISRVKKKVRLPEYFGFYILLFASGIISTVLSVNVSLSVRELYLWATYLLLFLGTINVLGYGWDRKSFLNSLMTVGLVFNLYRLAEEVSMYLAQTHVCKRMNSPNKTAAFSNILMMLAFFAFMNRKGKRRIFPGLVILSSAAVLTATASRGGIIASAAGIVVFFFVSYLYGKIDLRKDKLILLGAAVLVIIPIVSVLFTAPPDVCKSRWTSNVTTRMDYWEYGMVLVGKYPVNGSGLNTFQYLAAPHIGKRAAHPHNIFHRALIERGIVGLVISAGFLLGLLATLLFDTKDVYIKAAGLGLLALFLVHGLVDVTGKEPFVMRYMVITMGYFLSSKFDCKEREGCPEKQNGCGSEKE